MIIVPDIRCLPGESAETAIEKAAAALALNGSEVRRAVITRESIDARHKKVSILRSVGFELFGDEAEKLKYCDRAKLAAPAAGLNVAHGTQKLAAPPVIAGFGPAGMFAGLLLAREGYRPIIIERGDSIDERTAKVERFSRFGVLDTQSNIQFGEGGAGAFSDGKLTTRINDPSCGYILRELVRFGAPEEILYKAKPHVGTDLLVNTVKNIRLEIERLGGKVLFNTRLTGIKTQNGRLKAVQTENGEIAANALILAIGHSARDTFKMLLQSGVDAISKPFSVGVRIEHLQKDVNSALYGEYAGHPALGKAEYQHSLRDEKTGRAVYTFCMCPGGYVVPAASEEGGVVTNGMSYHQRGGKNANSALVVSVDARDFGDSPLAGMEFQRRLEQKAFALSGSYKAPIQTVGAFTGRGSAKFGRVEPTYPIGVVDADFNRFFPAEISSMLGAGINAFERRQQGFSTADSLLTGVETRTSSPIRIPRGEDMQSVSLKGIYPCGEGAGYAGGIMSAAADGLRVAKAIIENYEA
ncbi:MAG: hypothetical protein IJF27_01410 [Oscillospiraceae bacterium]|nr:hypothetical protein [Oscillospiraceae bacterium]MBQ3048916.1 hypothetical protein [Oscillospiraceae bacterium]